MFSSSTVRFRRLITASAMSSPADKVVVKDLVLVGGGHRYKFLVKRLTRDVNSVESFIHGAALFPCCSQPRYRPEVLRHEATSRCQGHAGCS